MKVNFKYDKEKDIWCLLNKGKSSNNSKSPTSVYEQLVSMFGDNPSEENTSIFIDRFLSDNSIDVNERLEEYQRDWETVAQEFVMRAEKIFNITLPTDVTAYATVNNRCPYNFKENYFYISFSYPTVRKTIMHELWHFYTWHGLGTDQPEVLGDKKFNDLKESLTVLLNVECADLLPPGVEDTGYPQHQEMRKLILEYWEKDKNMKNLWEYLISL